MKLHDKKPGASPVRKPLDLDELAAQQGVKPVARFEDLLGDFWPEDERIEDFLAWLDESRGRPRRASNPDQPE